jgi:hypothetical protein
MGGGVMSFVDVISRPIDHQVSLFIVTASRTFGLRRYKLLAGDVTNFWLESLQIFGR